MKKYIFFLIFLCSLETAHAKIDGYQSIKYSWFAIHISEEAIYNHTKETKTAIALLKKKILLIQQLKIPKKIKDQLATVPIFLEWNLGNAGAMYHPSKTWLLENGYIGEKEKSVEITNLSHFVEWTNLNQPHMITHELAHAYMDKFVSEAGKKAIKNAYENALKSWLYNSVEYTPGGNMVKIQKKAYALTNELEYFAELSEAYLGRNDFYPYTKAELKKYDNVGYTLMWTIWK